MRILLNAMKVVVKPLKKLRGEELVEKTREPVQWKCVPLLLSYCCDMYEAKGTSAQRHGVAVRRPCITCMVTRNNTMFGELPG